MTNILTEKCICCGNLKFKQFSSNSYIGLPVFQCQNCKLLISGNDEMKMNEKVKQVYEKEYWDEQDSEMAINSNYSDHRSLVLKKRWMSQINYCKPEIISKKIVLEIGSGGGQALSLFKENGFNVMGIEPDNRNVTLINQKLNQQICHKGYAEDFPINQKFDVVWMSHVLEHTIRPDKLFIKIKSILNLKGLFFVDVPNCENPIVLESSINQNPSTFHFTMNALKKLGQKSGFKLIKSDYFILERSINEKFNRALQKFTRKKLSSAPFHFSNTLNKEIGVDLRLLYMKN